MNDLGPIFRTLMRNRLGALLIALQIALTLAIVTNAGFIIQQRAADIARPTGLDEPNTGLLITTLFDSRLDQMQIIRDDLDALRAIPGVVSAVAEQLETVLAQNGHSVTLAQIEPADPADTRSFTAARASLGTAALTGIAGLTATGSALGLEMNTADDPGDLDLGELLPMALGPPVVLATVELDDLDLAGLAGAAEVDVLQGDVALEAELVPDEAGLVGDGGEAFVAEGVGGGFEPLVGGLEVLEGFGGVLGLLGLGEPFGEGEGVGAPGVLGIAFEDRFRFLAEAGFVGFGEEGGVEGEEAAELGFGLLQGFAGLGGFLGGLSQGFGFFCLGLVPLLVDRALGAAHGAVAVAVLVVEAEGVVEEGGELVGLPRYGLGGGLLALVGIAEGTGEAVGREHDRHLYGSTDP